MTGDYEWVLEMLYVAKCIYDDGDWNVFTDMLTQNMHEYVGSVEFTFDPEWDAFFYTTAISSVFQTVKSYYNKEREWDIFVFWDPLMYRYNKLCREYEARRGIVEIENPYVREAEQAIRSAMDFSSYSYDYRWTTGTKNPKDSKPVLIEDPDFCNQWEVPRGLTELRAFYVEGVRCLEVELAPKKSRKTRKRKAGKVIVLPAQEDAPRKEAA